MSESSFLDDYGYNEEGLKSCPFCGCEIPFLCPVSSKGIDGGFVYGVVVECPDCEIKTVPVLQQSTAKLLWNRRANEKA